MRIFRFLIFTLLTTALVVALNIRIGETPALGKLLNPFTGVWNNAVNHEVALASEISLSNVREPVEVYFDERHIPHIFATTEHDLYYAQGYIVASLRLWQMEFQVLAAEGRVSELIGEKGLEFDMNQRKSGMVFGAKNKLAEIESDPLAKDLIGAYTEGVNDYINQVKKKDLPIEYKLLGYEPEPWSAYKTALLLMNMSKVLTSSEFDIENTNFMLEYGQPTFDSLFGEWYDELDPIFPTPTGGWDNHFTIQNAPVAPLEADTNPVVLSDLGIKPDVQIGSNNWALSGSRTKSGKPLLSNDPHLGLTFPSVWIEMHLSGPESNTYGVVFPGAPGIIIGFNDKIGWGVTNAGRDVKDWFTIEFKDASKTYYKWGKGWRKTTKSIEEYKVKNGATVTDTLIFTHLGPVYHQNLSTRAGKLNLAVEWMAHQPGKEYMTFYLLNRAQNFEQYMEALKHYNCPAQNFVFAAVDGDIALRQQGKFPILKGQEGRSIQDGSMNEAWDEFIPFNEMPTMHNPERGFVSSANQQVTDTTYPYYYNGTFEYYRNRIINGELSDMENADVADMKELQYNNYNLLAAEALPHLLAHLSTFEMNMDEQDVVNALNRWNYQNTKESVAATYFQAFYDNYYTTLWDELTEEEIAHSWLNYYYKDGLIAPNDYQTIALLRDSVQHQFIDHASTTQVEDMTDIVEIAFDKAVKQIQGTATLEWGEYKSTEIKHLLRLDALSTTVDVGGGYKMVNASGRAHGPSWRMILDFDDNEIKGWGVYPGGQSGNPGSPLYDNMVEEWKEGDYHELNNSSNKADFENENFTKIVLQP